MVPIKKNFLLILLIVVAALLLIGPVSARAATDKTKPAAAKPPARQKDLSKYVGSDVCQSCHDEVYKKFETTPHWKTMTDKRAGPDKQGCESCHGPGADHVEAGGDKAKIIRPQALSASKVSENCLTCHLYGEEHSNFARSAHKTSNVSCIQCHSVHKAKEAQFLLQAKQPELCYSCHLDVKPQFAKPFRHRVNENLVKCTDCHNQHGGFLTRSLRATSAQDITCFKCHVDKVGPYVFEHPPVKTEGCVACHMPHGSSNPRLLKRSQVNLLCLECHTLTADVPSPGIPTFHNQSQKYQACTMCHVAVHGSNTSSVFFKQ
jgi:DmsE family decaheme c-type cytochrome